MAVIDIISAHSTDEEYLGERKDLSSWSGVPKIIQAFYRFSMEMKRKLRRGMLIQALGIDVVLGLHHMSCSYQVPGLGSLLEGYLIV